jgi:hypothetical protein
MSIEIRLTNKRTLGERYDWEAVEDHGDHEEVVGSGTVTTPPSDMRGPTQVEWDDDMPDCWEDIEDKIKEIV